MTPLVSIVVCTHNRASFLRHTMDTIFAQEYEPAEILIVDDGSTDGTRELIESYGDRVRYFRKEKSTIAHTRSVACRLAQGEYIAFQDDDDLMVPDRIGLLHDALMKQPEASLALGDWAYIDADGNDTGKKSMFHIHAKGDEPILLNDGYRAVLWPLVTPLPHTTLFRKADGERIGWFDEKTFFHGCSDTDFFARIGKLGSIVYVPKIVSYYRMGHAQIWGNSFLGEYSRFLLLEKHLKELNNGDREMAARLRQRLLYVLMSIAFLRENGHSMPASVPRDYVRRGLNLLGTMDQISYHFYSGLRLPIRSLIKGRGTSQPDAVKR